MPCSTPGGGAHPHHRHPRNAGERGAITRVSATGENEETRRRDTDSRPSGASMSLLLLCTVRMSCQPDRGATTLDRRMLSTRTSTSVKSVPQVCRWSVPSTLSARPTCLFIATGSRRPVSCMAVTRSTAGRSTPEAVCAHTATGVGRWSTKMVMRLSRDGVSPYPGGPSRVSALTTPDNRPLVSEGPQPHVLRRQPYPRAGSNG